jgi:cytochrome c peroxidase
MMFVAGPAIASEFVLSEDEAARIVQHGPWPPPPRLDPSNRVSGKPAAIDLGRRLFFDARLSASGTISCATCHKPNLGWTDGKVTAGGLARLDRNTQSIADAGFNRWFGWDGRSDSLWAHSIGPILDPREMGADAAHVARVVAGDPDLAARYLAAFATPARGHDPETLLVDVAKALAAFQETIVTPRTAFDAFRDALLRGDRTAARYPAAAQRGAKLFFGRGNCFFCHTGAAFTNGEFADAGVPHFIRPGVVDPGRHGGILKLKASPYALTGPFNDDPSPEVTWATRQVATSHANFGAFKVPSLRGLKHTAPYMHNGSRATLADVVRHYSEIDPDRLHSDGERILAPLGLSDAEIADLVAFLETLSE